MIKSITSCGLVALLSVHAPVEGAQNFHLPLQPLVWTCGLEERITRFFQPALEQVFERL